MPRITPPSATPQTGAPRPVPPTARPPTPAPVPAGKAAPTTAKPATPPAARPAPVRTPEQEQQLRALVARIKIRRARPNDSALLGKILAASEGKKTPLSRAEVLQRFGKWGFWLAEADGQVWGMATWRAENLVAVLRDLWVRHPDLSPYIFPRLFQAIEEEANSLVCEVVALIANPNSDAFARSTVLANGFNIRTLESLHPVWRSVAKSELRDRDILYIKQLRERMITSPI